MMLFILNLTLGELKVKYGAIKSVSGNACVYINHVISLDGCGNFNYQNNSYTGYVFYLVSTDFHGSVSITQDDTLFIFHFANKIKKRSAYKHPYLSPYKFFYLLTENLDKVQYNVQESDKTYIVEFYNDYRKWIFEIDKMTYGIISVSVYDKFGNTQAKLSFSNIIIN
jgi:hypothetical protein